MRSAIAAPASRAASPIDSGSLIRRRPLDATSRKALELSEVGLSLFDVRVATLLPFLRQVIEQRRVAGELLQPGLAVAVRIERGLEAAQRHRAVREHLAAPVNRFRFEILVRHDAVDEAHLERLPRVVLAAKEPDLARLLLADDARHVR